MKKDKEMIEEIQIELAQACRCANMLGEVYPQLNIHPLFERLKLHLENATRVDHHSAVVDLDRLGFHDITWLH